MGCLVGRGDEVGYCLCLREVHFAVEIGTTGVLARICLSAACLGEALENLLKNVSAAMAGNLGGVFSGVAVRRLEYAYQHIVDGVAVLVLDFTIMDGVGFRIGQGFAAGRCEHMVGDANGIMAAESDDSDGATGWGCQGADTFFLILHYFSLNSV